MVNNRFEQNVFEQNTEAGFQIHDPSRHTATDYFLTESFANANTGAGFKLDTTAGALIRGNHLYSNGVDIDINIASQALRIQANCEQPCHSRPCLPVCAERSALNAADFEDGSALRIETFNPGESCELSGNIFEGDL